MKHYLISIIILAAAYLSMQGAVAEGENDTLWTKLIDGITDVKFSPEGKTIAAGRENGEVYFLNSLNGDSLYKILHPGGATLDYSPDGKYLLTGGGGLEVPDNEKAKLWDLETKNLLINLSDTIKSYGPAIKSAESVAFSPNGKYIAAGYQAGSYELAKSYIVVWNNDSFIPIAYNSYPGVFITKIKFSPDVKFLAATFWYKKSNYVLLIDTETWDEKMPALQHPDMVEDFTFTSDGSKLITGCDDGNIRIWNTETKELERILKVEGNIKSMGISTDNNYIFYQWKYGLKSGLFKKDMKNEEIVYKYNTDVFPEGRTSMNSIDVSPNQPYFVAGSSVGLCVYKSDLLSSINETEQLIETIYPNPTNGMLKINFYNPIYQFLRVELQNISGALIDTIFSGNLEQGKQSINYNGNDIFAGNYIITISAKGFSKSFKFIKEK